MELGVRMVLLRDVEEMGEIDRIIVRLRRV